MVLGEGDILLGMIIQCWGRIYSVGEENMVLGKEM